MIPIFNVVLISDKDENEINNSKHVILFLLKKIYDKFYGNIVYKKQTEMSNFIQVPTSLVFAAISEIWFSGFSRLTIYELITTVTVFLTAFLIKINNKKLDQAIYKLLTLCKYFTCSLSLLCNIFGHPLRVYIITDNNYKPLKIFEQVDVYLNKPIKIDELIKIFNQ